MLVEGPRQARPEEIEQVTDLVSTIFRFGHYGREHMIEAMRRPVMETGRVIVEQGVPVSYIYAHDSAYNMYGCTTRVSSIGCVCTREDRRNQGFADAILKHHIERLAAAGVRLMIVSGGRGLYRRNHCVSAGFAYHAKFTRNDVGQAPSPVFPGAAGTAPPQPGAAPFTALRASSSAGSGQLVPHEGFSPQSSQPRPVIPSGLSIRRVTLDDWPTLAPLYEAEPAHFVRPADLEQNLCFWWNCHKADIYLIESDGRPVAYAALATHRHDDEHLGWISEYAGSRGALLDALPLLFEATDAPVIVLGALAQDAELRYRFSRLGLEVTSRTISGTMRIIDLPGLMSDLRQYVAARVPERDLSRLSFAQEGETCTFALGQEAFSCDLSAAARLVCGGPEAPELAGELGRVLSAIFPLPTIQPGFNYV
jgi:predicted N-acetyltransferase YhbS